MRVRCHLGVLLAIGILALSSCVTPPPNIKPPLHEEYVLPPTDDPRFSMPPQYPKEALDNGMPKKDQTKPGDQFRGPGSGRVGGGSGIGGY